jgi:hypothetical protein
MNPSSLGQKSLRVSYAVFFAVLVGFLCFVVVFAGRKPPVSPAPLAALFGFAFLWQVFTLYHHRRAFLALILTVLYGIAAVAFAVSSLH